MLLANLAENKLLRKSVMSGSTASLLSAISLAILGKGELGKTAAPMNGPSQWVWGKYASFLNYFSWQYTGVGYIIHHAASIFWALFYEKNCENMNPKKNCQEIIIPALMVSAVAYVVDFYVVPKRFSPGFERRLSKESLFIVYGVFALGLAGGNYINRNLLKINKLDKN